MERLNLTLPQKYKKRFQEMADEKGISASELLRHWIDRKEELENEER